MMVWGYKGYYCENQAGYSIRLQSSGIGGAIEGSFAIEIIDASDNQGHLMASPFMSNNRDGFNDFFLIQNFEIYAGYTLFIFSSSGQEVYRATNYQNNWDGYYNGSPLPSGAYFYIFKSPNGTNDFKGSINIIKK